jgi:esterase FrsA
VNDIDELKKFASVHSKLQGLPGGLWEDVLERIEHDGNGTPGSWVYEWSRAGERFEEEGDLLNASRCYILARFPFVDDTARQSALDHAVDTFDRWRSAYPQIERLDLELGSPKGRVRCWVAGLEEGEHRPLLLFMGGIVSLKEQWAPLLLLADQLGMAMVVAELPGVGENTLPYDADSWRMLPAILDALAERADVEHTFALANSFSGHLALRSAAHDPRFRGVISNAAPIADFFTDRDWQRQLPKVTADTLRFLTGSADGELADRLADWALSDDLLKSLDVPVAYMGSLRDEIIPRGESERLRGTVRRLSLKVFDDVHASPQHLEETRDWLFGALARMRQDDAAA